MKNLTYTKELGDSIEGIILQARSVVEISHQMVALYEFMEGVLLEDDPESINRIYDIILKGTKLLKTLAEKRGIVAWDGTDVQQTILKVD